MGKRTLYWRSIRVTLDVAERQKFARSVMSRVVSPNMMLKFLELLQMMQILTRDFPKKTS